ncbi:MAG: MFS transporter [Anaerolineales bacterium]
MTNKQTSPVERSKITKTLPRNVWAVTITSFLTDVSSEMLFNLLPLYLFNVLGVRTSLIGVIEGLADSVASLMKMVSGWLSDRWGNRKWLAVSGYALSTVIKPLLYFTTTWSGVLGVRFGDRVGKGIRTAPRDALVADSVDEGQRGLAFGLHRAGDTAGAVLGIGIALVVVLVARHPTGGLERDTFQTVVLLSALPALLAVFVLVFGVREVSDREAQDVGEDQIAVGGSKDQISEPTPGRAFWIFIAIAVIFGLGNASDAFLILRGRVVGLTVPGVLGMMLSFNLVYALVATPAGRLSDRVGRRTMLIGGWLFYALVYLGFWRVSTGWQAWALMLMYGLYYGLTEGSLRAYVADLVPASYWGRAYGILHTALGVVAFPASLIAGLLWQGVGSWKGFGPGAPFLFGAVSASLAAAGLLLLPWFTQIRREEPFS